MATKLTIGQLFDIQKILTETLKQPMKWKTALSFKEYLETTNELVKKAIKDFGVEKKNEDIIKAYAEEVEKKTEELMNNEEELKEFVSRTSADKQEDFENIKGNQLKIALIVNDDQFFKAQSEASRMESELNAQIKTIELNDVPVLEYVLDESLPALFNLWIKDSPLGFAKFKLRDTKK